MLNINIPFVPHRKHSLLPSNRQFSSICFSLHTRYIRLFLAAHPVYLFVSRYTPGISVCFSLHTLYIRLFLSPHPVYLFVSRYTRGISVCFSLHTRYIRLFLATHPVYPFVSRYTPGISVRFSLHTRYICLFLAAHPVYPFFPDSPVQLHHTNSTHMTAAHQFVGAFEKLQNAPIIFVMSVRLSIRPHRTFRRPPKSFS
jgi:hypothetical protein